MRRTKYYVKDQANNRLFKRMSSALKILLITAYKGSRRYKNDKITINLTSLRVIVTKLAARFQLNPRREHILSSTKTESNCC